MNGYLSFGHRRGGGLRKSTEGKSGLVDYEDPESICYTGLLV